MDMSIFLAKALGIYLVVLSIGMLMNRDKVMTPLMDILDRPGILLFSGILPLIIGTLLVISHNIWTTDWRVLITLLGWSALIKGTMVIIYPNMLINMSKKWLESQIAYKTTYIITLIIGLYLGYVGFF